MTGSLEDFHSTHDARRPRRPYSFYTKKRNKVSLPTDEKRTGVYTITCTANQMVYVGCSTHLYLRICVHIAKLRSGKHNVSRMLQDFRIHGEDAFLFEIFEQCESIEDALEKESALIIALAKEKRVYNKAGTTEKFKRRADRPVETPPDRTVRLRQWMLANGKTEQDLSRVAELSQARVARIMAGEVPCLQELRRIFEWSSGELSMQDFYRPEYTHALQTETAA